jgi:hypothetical protein
MSKLNGRTIVIFTAVTQFIAFLATLLISLFGDLYLWVPFLFLFSGILSLIQLRGLR